MSSVRLAPHPSRGEVRASLARGCRPSRYFGLSVSYQGCFVTRLTSYTWPDELEFGGGLLDSGLLLATSANMASTCSSTNLTTRCRPSSSPVTILFTTRKSARRSFFRPSMHDSPTEFLEEPQSRRDSVRPRGLIVPFCLMALCFYFLFFLSLVDSIRKIVIRLLVLLVLLAYVVPDQT